MSERSKRERIEELERLVENVIERLNMDADRLKALDLGVERLVSMERFELDKQQYIDRVTSRLTALEEDAKVVQVALQERNSVALQVEKLGQRVAQLEAEARAMPGWGGVPNAPATVGFDSKPSPQFTDRMNEKLAAQADLLSKIGTYLATREGPKAISLYGDLVKLGLCDECEGWYFTGSGAKSTLQGAEKLAAQSALLRKVGMYLASRPSLRDHYDADAAEAIALYISLVRLGLCPEFQHSLQCRETTSIMERGCKCLG